MLCPRRQRLANKPKSGDLGRVSHAGLLRPARRQISFQDCDVPQPSSTYSANCFGRLGVRQGRPWVLQSSTSGLEGVPSPLSHPISKHQYLTSKTTIDNSRLPLGDKPAEDLEEKLGTWAKQIANLFPVWLTIVGALSVVHPPSMLWFRSKLVTAGLAVTMGTMGTTLTVQARDSPFPTC